MSSKTRVRVARWPIAATFFVNGALLAAWVSRIPAVKTALRLSDGQLGFALFGTAVGAWLSFPVAGQLVPRFGSRRVVVAAGLALCAVLAALPSASSSWSLTPLLTLLGAGNGIMDVSMNAQGVDVERNYGRSIMSSLHGMWSLGGLSGAALGGWLTARGLTPLVHFGAVGGTSALGLILIALCLLPPAPSDGKPTAHPPVFAWPD